MESVEMLYWHWVVLGIGLAVLEIFLASFTVLWFGIGAIVVGLVLWVFPSIPFAAQLLLWMISSSGLAVFWFKYFKPRMVDKTRAGMAREAVIGEFGQVIKAPFEGGRGMARFSTPILGSDEWEIISKDDIIIGDRITIREFSGNTLVVTKT
ncbi:MAG: NfeD family protein [Porticoccaceae bacterium]|nr:NfeD family protein [Porticoccaceae bacterium]